MIYIIIYKTFLVSNGFSMTLQISQFLVPPPLNKHGRQVVGRKNAGQQELLHERQRRKNRCGQSVSGFSLEEKHYSRLQGLLFSPDFEIQIIWSLHCDSLGDGSDIILWATHWDWDRIVLNWNLCRIAFESCCVFVSVPKLTTCQ